MAYFSFITRLKILIFKFLKENIKLSLALPKLPSDFHAIGFYPPRISQLSFTLAIVTVCKCAILIDEISYVGPSRDPRNDNLNLYEFFILSLISNLSIHFEIVSAC